MKCYIVDTTLRDGEQSAGLAFSVAHKVKLAALIEALGVYQIEGGIPALGKSEKAAIDLMMANKKNALISAWNRLDLSDIKHSIECKPDIIHISVPVSYIYIYSKLKKNKQWIKNNLIKCVSLALEKGFQVTVGFEDASRADLSFVITLVNLLKEMGISRIRYADTVGTLTPKGMAKTVQAVQKYTGIDLEVHVHDDFGMAVANSLEAAKQGAKYIDCTFFGIGERAGNCDFGKFIKASQNYFDLGLNQEQLFPLQQQIKAILTKKHEN